ncbi:MAG: hypothetical protein JWL82_573 [Parcubacteria group bacterium]|nr:hypothetical protein [Parcubacteria group bacterium]
MTKECIMANALLLLSSVLIYPYWICSKTSLLPLPFRWLGKAWLTGIILFVLLLGEGMLAVMFVLVRLHELPVREHDVLWPAIGGWFFFGVLFLFRSMAHLAYVAIRIRRNLILTARK